MVYKIATTKRFDKDYEKLSEADRLLAKTEIISSHSELFS